jgi:DNA-binding MarR family transcriptional regulator
MPGSKRPPREGGPRAGSVAFLLAQIGAHAAGRFAERIAVLDLTPPQAGLLRAVASEPGRSQQAVAGQLGVPPSRFVVLVDMLEERGLVERRRSGADRRSYGLYLTDAGEQMMRDLGALAKEHDDEICAGLAGPDRAALHATLVHIAQTQGLTPGVHPGYRHLGRQPGD